METKAIQLFAEQLRGELIQPADQHYDVDRKLYNAMVDRRPRLIARCADVADIITAVKFAREHSLLLAVRVEGTTAGVSALAMMG